jgi:hypothetical protein
MVWYYGKILSLATPGPSFPIWAYFDGGIGYLRLPPGAPPNEGNHALMAANAWANDRYVYVLYRPEDREVYAMYTF